jgi:hypothetical protein
VEKNNFTKELGDLSENIGKILLMVIDGTKVQTTSELIKKYTQDFYSRIEYINNKEDMLRAFNPWVNNLLSICETLGIPNAQWRPTRKLILNDLYKFKDTVLLKGLEK